MSYTISKTRQIALLAALLYSVDSDASTDEDEDGMPSEIEDDDTEEISKICTQQPTESSTMTAVAVYTGNNAICESTASNKPINSPPEIKKELQNFEELTELEVHMSRDTRIRGLGDGFVACRLCWKVFNVELYPIDEFAGHPCKDDQPSTREMPVPSTRQNPLPALLQPTLIVDPVIWKFGNPSSSEAVEHHVATTPVTADTAQFFCDICNKQYASSQSLYVHKRYVHQVGPRPECFQCNRRFNTLVNYQKHLELHEEAQLRPEVCEECGHRFRDIIGLQKHIHFIHNINRNALKCWYCSEQFADEASKSAHEASQHVPHPCRVCGKTFFCANQLRRHETQVHAGNNTPPEMQRHGACTTRAFAAPPARNLRSRSTTPRQH